MSDNTFDIFKYSNINLNNFTLSSMTTHNLISKVISKLPVTKNEDDSIVNVCKVCGRTLKDIDSCHMGMGPICFQRYKQTLNKTKPLF